MCLRASQEELGRYLIRLQNANMLEVKGTLEAPRGPDGEMVYAGGFCVAKGADQDRSITDRRRMHYLEEKVHTPTMAHASQLNRSVLQPHEFLLMQISDLRD